MFHSDEPFLLYTVRFEMEIRIQKQQQLTVQIPITEEAVTGFLPRDAVYNAVIVHLYVCHARILCENG